MNVSGTNPEWIRKFTAYYSELMRNNDICLLAIICWKQKGCGKQKIKFEPYTDHASAYHIWLSEVQITIKFN